MKNKPMHKIPSKKEVYGYIEMTFLKNFDRYSITKIIWFI